MGKHNPDYVVCDCGRKVDTPKLTWIHVKDDLPNNGEPILAKGYFELEFETLYEEGFRSTTDKIEELKDGQWMDFPFNVTHWLPLTDT